MAACAASTGTVSTARLVSRVARSAAASGPCLASTTMLASTRVDDEVLERLGHWLGAADVFLCGHSHLPRVRHLPGGALVVNPGSLGWPAYEDDEPPHRVQTGSPHARFVVLDSDASQQCGWRATPQVLDYPVEEAAQLAEANNRPDVARALRTGLV